MIIFATNNEHKMKEVRQILPNEDICSLKEANINIDIVESGVTYYDNAMIKAVEIAKFTNLPVLADDSGLEIEELKGEMGVHTARFHPELNQHEKNQLVLDLLKAKSNRKAAYVCCAVIYYQGKEYHYEHRCEGTIALKPAGECGFGFDPIFIPCSLNKTFAEATDEEKNAISHRGVAMRKLIEIVRKEVKL